MNTPARKCSLEYLKAVATSEGGRRHKARAHELLEVSEGSRLLDVGCGPGVDTVALGRVTGPTGAVIGVDADPSMVEEANRLAVESGVGGWVRHLVDSATDLALVSDSMDACYCERVLQHLSWKDANQSVASMRRVLKPGGRIVLVDTDWATLSIAAVDPWLERRVVNEHLQCYANPCSGRYLSGLLFAHGFAVVGVESQAMGLGHGALQSLLAPAVERGVASNALTVAEAWAWWSGLQQQAAYDQVFAHVVSVIAAGVLR